MANILTTIPKKKFKSWQECEKVLKKCDGEDKKGRRAMFWVINTAHLPKKIDFAQSVCFLIYDGQVRGYMNIVDTDKSENWRLKHNLGKPRTTDCIVMANWHPITPTPYVGFQGWRYTELRP